MPFISRSTQHFARPAPAPSAIAAALVAACGDSSSGSGTAGGGTTPPAASPIQHIVVILWNYAQHFALNDNSYGTTFGPSNVGAQNLISGQTNGVVATNAAAIPGGGANIDGELSNDGAGGLTITATRSRSATSAATATRCNHRYDPRDFFDAVDAGNFPTVSFLKAAGYQDGHAGYSSPLDEQTFIVDTIDFLQQQPGWANTVVVIAYDDSDGRYDHPKSPLANASARSASAAGFTSNDVPVAGLGDGLNGAGVCNTGLAGTATTAVLTGPDGVTPLQGRCGYGPRLPLLVISPRAKVNFVDHTQTDQTSILRFIEDTGLAGARIPGSFDSLADSLTNMLDTSGSSGSAPELLLDADTGLPQG